MIYIVYYYITVSNNCTYYVGTLCLFFKLSIKKYFILILIVLVIFIAILIVIIIVLVLAIVMVLAIVRVFAIVFVSMIVFVNVLASANDIVIVNGLAFANVIVIILAFVNVIGIVIVLALSLCHFHGHYVFNVHSVYSWLFTDFVSFFPKSAIIWITTSHSRIGNIVCQARTGLS